MTRSRSLLFAISAAALFVAAPIAFDQAQTPAIGFSSAKAATEVNINLFFTNLAPYGSWIQNPQYNYIWVPGIVDASWSPYTNGHWIYTDTYGWYFVSDEPFAWIVYHYGRWGYDPVVGWFWVPGTHWGPAWVAWRRGTDSVGWAPLPPQGTGYATSVNININIGDVPEHYWRFVPGNQFLAPRLNTVVVAGDRQPAFFQRTQPAGTVIVQNNVVINNVININFIEDQTKQKVQVAKVDKVADPKDAEGNQQTSPTSVKAFIADLRPPTKTEAPPKVVAKTEIPAAPTKGQTDKPSTTIGALPDTGQLGTPNANPKCTDATFAKANPKDCAPAGGNASATANPNAGGPGAGGPNGTGGPNGQGGANGNANANATDAKCTDATYAKANPKDCASTGTDTANNNPNAGGTPATGGPSTNGPGNAAAGGVNANANVNVGNPKCTDATFAKNNPKTCATGQGNAGGAAANGSASIQGGSNANGNGPNAGGGNTSVQGNLSGNARCADPTYAKNNPKTCGTATPAGPANDNPGGAANGGAKASGGAGPNANIQGITGANVGTGNPGGGEGPAIQGNAGANVGEGNPGGGKGGQGGTATGQGNATLNTANRCEDPTFARNNPKTCTPPDGQAQGNVQGNAGANAGGNGKPAATGNGNFSVQGNAGANAGGNGKPAATGSGNFSVQGNANLPEADCSNPAFAKANPKSCAIPAGPGAPGPMRY